MTERPRRQSRITDVEKTFVSRRNFKGGRSNELVITGRPCTQGEIDLKGLLTDIQEAEQRHQEWLAAKKTARQRRY